jgi:hypothetical protein
MPCYVCFAPRQQKAAHEGRPWNSSVDDRSSYESAPITASIRFFIVDRSNGLMM